MNVADRPIRIQQWPASSVQRFVWQALDWLGTSALWLCAAVSILVSLGILVLLLIGAAEFFVALVARPDQSPLNFFTDTQWSPSFADQHFGIWPLLHGTLMVTLGAALLAVPLGLPTALYLSEFASPRFRSAAKPVLEVISGVPSIVFGYVAVVFISPLIRRVHPEADFFNAASAAIVVAVMVLPMLITLSVEALRSVPNSLRNAAYAVGASEFDVTFRVTLPAAAPGVMAAFLLAVSRAVGETMAVTMAAGMRPAITLNMFSSIETMTAAIVHMTSGDTPKDSIEYKSIFAIGLTLFCLTLFMNSIAHQAMRQIRRRHL